MRTVLAIGLAAVALAGLLAGHALGGGDGATLAAQDGDFVSPREAVILAQRINELEARVAELEARALPPQEPADPGIAWTDNGFRLVCLWQPVAIEGMSGIPDAETRKGSCVRLGPGHH